MSIYLVHLDQMRQAHSPLRCEIRIWSFPNQIKPTIILEHLMSKVLKVRKD